MRIIGVSLGRADKPAVERGDALGAPELSADSWTTPVIFVGVGEPLKDRVQVLDLGVDDYSVESFEYSELVARARAVWRRCGRISNRAAGF